MGNIKKVDLMYVGFLVTYFKLYKVKQQYVTITIPYGKISMWTRLALVFSTNPLRNFVSRVVKKLLQMTIRKQETWQRISLSGNLEILHKHKENSGKFVY